MDLQKLREHFRNAPFAVDTLTAHERGTILAEVAHAESGASKAALDAGDDLQYSRVKAWANRAYVLLGAPDEEAN